jgi:hypothetical protein
VGPVAHHIRRRQNRRGPELSRSAVVQQGNVDYGLIGGTGGHGAGLRALPRRESAVSLCVSLDGQALHLAGMRSSSARQEPLNRSDKSSLATHHNTTYLLHFDESAFLFAGCQRLVCSFPQFLRAFLAAFKNRVPP